MFIPEIPNNNLKPVIEKLVFFCEQLSEDYLFEFGQPLTVTAIEKFEKETEITLPQSYKEWLQFTSHATIRSSAAEFYDVVNNPYFVRDDMIILGSIVGDGEGICLSRETGKLFGNNHGEIYEINDFGDVLNSITEVLSQC